MVQSTLKASTASSGTTSGSWSAVILLFLALFRCRPRTTTAALERKSSPAAYGPSGGVLRLPGIDHEAKHSSEIDANLTTLAPMLAAQGSRERAAMSVAASRAGPSPPWAPLAARDKSFPGQKKLDRLFSI